MIHEDEALLADHDPLAADFRALNPSSTFYALRSPAYRVLWANSIFMLAAVHMAFTAHNVVAYDLTGKNGSVGLISFAIGSALLLTTPISGSVADRLSKRVLLL